MNSSGAAVGRTRSVQRIFDEDKASAKSTIQRDEYLNIEFRIQLREKISTRMTHEEPRKVVVSSLSSGAVLRFTLFIFIMFTHRSLHFVYIYVPFVFEIHHTQTHPHTNTHTHTHMYVDTCAHIDTHLSKTVADRFGRRSEHLKFFDYQ